MDLRQIFIQLVNRYSSDGSISISLWNEIEKKYGSHKRYYHTLLHLEVLLDQLGGCKQLIADWDTLLFSVFYHDIVYNVLKSNNEERSADLAVKRLSATEFRADKINTCKEQILATKSHLFSNDEDTDLFTDADLSVLGQPPDLYEQYCRQIRQEYSIFPDLVYKPGRKKVVIHFLKMEKIFKTYFFYDRYEAQARKNLESELTGL
jgi:predicted metal-dependent HD superfamily phosphohydrolase